MAGYNEENLISAMSDMIFAMKKHAENLEKIINTDKEVDQIALNKLKAKIKHCWFDGKMLILQGMATHRFCRSDEIEYKYSSYNSKWKERLRDFVLNPGIPSKDSMLLAAYSLKDCCSLVEEFSDIFRGAMWNSYFNRIFGDSDITEVMDLENYNGIQVFSSEINRLIDATHRLTPDTRRANVLLLNFERYNDIFSSKYPGYETFCDNIDFYGSYNGNFVIGELREMFTKVAIGEQDSIISTNNAYDLSIIKTLCTGYNIRSLGLSNREYMEDKGLMKAIRYTRDNGYIAIITPRWALTRNFLDILCSSGNIVATARENIVNGIYNADMVMIILKKMSIEKEKAVSNFNSWRNIVADDDPFNTLFVRSDRIFEKFNENDLREVLLDASRNIKFFKGSQPDMQIMMSLLRSSTAFAKVKKQEVIHDIKPLLPFNNGQIGQVLASGKLDGLIEEPSTGCKHVIRGRVYKAPIQNIRFENDNGETLIDRITTTVRTNAVAINVFTGNGDFKTIAVSSSS